METRLSWRLLSGADNFSTFLPWRATEIYSWRCLKVRLVPPTTRERALFRIARRRSPGSAMATKNGGAAVASWGEGARRLAETRGWPPKSAPSSFVRSRHLPLSRSPHNGRPRKRSPFKQCWFAVLMSGELIKKQISKGNAGECKDVTTFVDDVASCHVSERKAKTRRGRVRCPASYQETFSPYVKSCNVFFPWKFTVVGTAWTWIPSLRTESDHLLNTLSKQNKLCEQYLCADCLSQVCWHRSVD